MKTSPSNNEPTPATGQTPANKQPSSVQSSPPVGVNSRPRIVYTAEREQTNKAAHGLSLADAERFDWDTATVRPGQYETRATGTLDGLVVVLSYRPGHDATRRVNLLRYANDAEFCRYVDRRFPRGDLHD